MLRSFVIILALTLWLPAEELLFSHGTVTAHTEILGDSEINPSTDTIVSNLKMDSDFTSIRGNIEVSVIALQSPNKKRDMDMVETMESHKYPIATYTFTSVTKENNAYLIQGELNLHGVTKAVTINAKFDELNNSIKLTGNTTILMTDFDIEPPTLFFFSVRDQVDLSIDVVFDRF